MQGRRIRDQPARQPRERACARAPWRRSAGGCRRVGPSSGPGPRCGPYHGSSPHRRRPNDTAVDIRRLEDQVGRDVIATGTCRLTLRFTLQRVVDGEPDRVQHGDAHLRKPAAADLLAGELREDGRLQPLDPQGSRSWLRMDLNYIAISITYVFAVLSWMARHLTPRNVEASCLPARAGSGSSEPNGRRIAPARRFVALLWPALPRCQEPAPAAAAAGWGARDHRAGAEAG